MKTVHLSLGSNVGEREANLQSAIDALHSPDIRITRISSVYETEPVDCPGQRWFLNLVAEAETGLFPMQLLSRAMRIERQLGRKRTIAKGPRTIDIDILLYGNFVVHSGTLEVPHPRLAERRFVLAPLAELAPDLRHPVTRQSVRQMLDATAGRTVKKIEFRPALPAA
jgi:2-amino-4-hydroxy-6-hydroxymethyldihydropteridine diphosphokinase